MKACELCLRAAGGEQIGILSRKLIFRLRRTPDIFRSEKNAWTALLYAARDDTLGWDGIFSPLIWPDVRRIPPALAIATTLAALWEVNSFERYGEWLDNPFHDPGLIFDAVCRVTVQSALDTNL